MFKKFFSIPLALGVMALPSVAATPAPAPAALPLPSNQLNIYFTMGAVNVCSLNKQGVPVTKAMQASIDQIGAIVYNVHGGTVDNQKISQQALLGLTLPNILYKVRGLCMSELPKADQDLINKDLAKFETLMKDSQKK